MFGFGSSLETIASFLMPMLFGGSSRQEYLADREHTEMREDTAIQRQVADYKAAGLNPYSISGSGAASSASSVGSQTAANRLQILGYVLDMQNLNLKNKKLANDAISGVLKALI